MKDIARQIANSGYAVIPGLLSTPEILRFRRAALDHFATSPHRRSNLGRNQPNFVRFVPRLAEVVRLPRVLDAFRSALGDEIVFTGQSDLSVGRLSGWHKDSDHLGPPQRVAAARDFRVIKAAIYLEDHLDQASAFHFRKDSLRYVSADEGEPCAVPLRAGDAVLFDVRLTHAGRFARPTERVIHRLSRLAARGETDPEFAVRLRERFWRLRGSPDRVGLFFTFGAPGSWTDTFARVNQERQAAYNVAAGLTGEPGVPEEMIASLRKCRVAMPGERASQRSW